MFLQPALVSQIVMPSASHMVYASEKVVGTKLFLPATPARQSSFLPLPLSVRVHVEPSQQLTPRALPWYSVAAGSLTHLRAHRVRVCCVGQL